MKKELIKFRIKIGTVPGGIVELRETPKVDDVFWIERHPASGIHKTSKKHTVRCSDQVKVTKVDESILFVSRW